MKKRNLLLLGIVFGLLILPIVFATIENTITNVSGNHSAIFPVLTTTQVTTNPEIDANVTYCTTVNITGGEDGLNLSSFLFYLPDNSTTQNETDFVLRNITVSASAQANATLFVDGDYNYVSFVNVCDILNGTLNGTTFNITYMLSEPIDSTKLSASRSGRIWTETWNITSSATNLTIENASLILTPTYWYTRIGDPTSIQFNSTAKGYSANLTAIKAYTDLNLSSNLLSYGSGWSTLSIAYNGPTIDTSSGSSPLEVTPTTPSEISDWLTPRGIIVLEALILIIGAIVIVVVLVAKKGKK